MFPLAQVQQQFDGTSEDPNEVRLYEQTISQCISGEGGVHTLRVLTDELVAISTADWPRHAQGHDGYMPNRLIEEAGSKSV